MNSELDDQVQELEKISAKISEVASDLMDDKYKSAQKEIAATLEKSKNDLERVIAWLHKLE